MNPLRIEKDPFGRAEIVFWLLEMLKTFLMRRSRCETSWFRYRTIGYRLPRIFDAYMGKVPNPIRFPVVESDDGDPVKSKRVPVERMARRSQGNDTEYLALPNALPSGAVA